MKILVFGATGGTGRAVVQRALKKGWEVTAIVRNPSSFNINHPNFKIIQGDVLKPSSFASEVVGKDVVISCLGTGTNLKPTEVYSAGIRNLLRAMHDAQVFRIICISAGGVEATNEMGFFIRTLTKALLQRILKNLYADMLLMEQQLLSSDTNYTIMRPARLTDGHATDNYRTAVNTHLVRPWSISKEDLAGYMINVIGNPQVNKSIIEIAY